VSNGLFTVTLDFAQPISRCRALAGDLALRSNGVATFTTLAPRQPLTARAVCGVCEHGEPT